jgi:hypothetical protein
MFFIVPEAGHGPMGLFLHLDGCFSFFQHRRKRKPVLEGCFPLFQHFKKEYRSRLRQSFTASPPYAACL